MPDIRYKVTFAFQTGGIGASESYITPATSSSDVTDRVQSLIASRNQLLFDVTTWRYVRIAQYGVRRRSTPYPPGTYQPFVLQQNLVVPGEGRFKSTPKTIRPDQARSCLQVRVGFDTDRTVIRYFAFVPDTILYDEATGVDMTQPPGWQLAYVNWVSRLVADGWCIRALQRDGEFAPKKILDWVTAAAAPNLMGFVLPALPAPGIAEGETVQVSGVRRRGTDKTSYNGRFFVQSVNSSLMPGYLIFYLRGTEAADPASIRKPGTVNKIGYSEFPFQRFTAVRPGVHKRGKPAGLPVGRRQTRSSLLA